MNVEHKDINKFIPYGEMLRGYSSQNLISKADVDRILRERGIFALNQEKAYTVPILQTLLLSPKEFEELRHSFSEREDNEKTISREIPWIYDKSIFIKDILSVKEDDFVKKFLPTCELKRPVYFTKLNGDENHLIADFMLVRRDRNKAWFEQTNIFSGKIELINKQGKGNIRITYTAPETKYLAEQIVRSQIKKYKEKGLISKDETLKKIIFSDFTNESRFIFFYRLTTQLDTDCFTCKNIRDISIKPAEDILLPDEIKWMDNMKKILLSGDNLDQKFFMKDPKYHKSIFLWSIEAVFSYEYKSEKGNMTLDLGFPDYFLDKDNAEFEINISQFNTEKRVDAKTKKKLKSQLLSEIDRQKILVYDKFLEDMKGK